MSQTDEQDYDRRMAEALEAISGRLEAANARLGEINAAILQIAALLRGRDGYGDFLIMVSMLRWQDSPDERWHIYQRLLRGDLSQEDLENGITQKEQADAGSGQTE